MKPLASKLRVALLEQLASAKEPDVRNAFAVYLELLMQWQLFAEQAEGLASELESSKMRPEVACALLHSLYSQAQQHGTLKLRFSLLLSLIKFCAKSDNLSKVLGPIDARVGRVERWVSEWELTESQQKQLWALVFDTHAEDGRILYESSLKYFALHEDADLKASPELRERIVKALLITIRSPDLFRCDELSQSRIVQQLEGDAQFAPLHRLLHIMARDTYSEFLTFAGEAASKSFMESHKLPVAACGDKMRLLTLVSLAHANKELGYKAVADALRIDLSEVETWVMQAIGNGLITAKMDQVNEVIAVSMCAERDFGQKQWGRLHTSLVDWRDSIRSLLDVLQTSRPAPA